MLVSGVQQKCISFVHTATGSYDLPLSFESCLNIVNTGPWSDVWSARIFLPLCGLSFHPLNRGFSRAKVLHFDEAQFVGVLLFYILAVLLSKKSFPKIFSCARLYVLEFTFAFKSIIHFELVSL